MLVLLWINFLLTLSHCVFTYIFKINQNGNVTLQIRFCEKVTHIRLFSRMCTKRNVRWIPCFFSFATTRRPCLIILCLWLVVDAILAFRSAFLCSGERRKFGVVSFSIRWSFVFGVRYLWRHNLTPYSCFQTNVLAKFVDIICVFFYTYSPYFMCHLT